MERISQPVLTFLLNSFWQTLLITAVAWLCDRLIHKAPARHRQLLWIAALLLSLLLPLLSLNIFLKSVPVRADARPVVASNELVKGGSVWLGDLLRKRNQSLPLTTSLATGIVGFY